MRSALAGGWNPPMPEPTNRSKRTRLLSHLAAGLRAFVVWDLPMDDRPPLHRCEHCGSDAVCPMDWDEIDDERWEIDLRCGECGHSRTTVAGNDEAAAFETVLRRHTARIELAVERLDRERMVVEVEQLAHALLNDLIDADDFAR